MSTPKGRTRTNKAKPAKAPAPQTVTESDGHNSSVAEYRDCEDLDLTPTFQEALDEIERQHAEMIDSIDASYEEAISSLKGESDDSAQ